MDKDQLNPLPECPGTPNCKRVTVSFDTDSTTTFAALNAALSKMGAETINEDGEKIDAVFRIPVFGWRDDVSILVKPENDSTTVFVRSASREGHWDIGANAIRINKLIRHTKKQLSN